MVDFNRLLEKSRARKAGEIVFDDTISPSDIGLSGFPSFRPGQWETINAIIASKKRFQVLKAPPGVGKTLIAAGVMAQLDARSVFLTGTIALQRQLVKDFPECVPIMGMGRYPCEKTGDFCDTGPCHTGDSCNWKASGCQYFDQVRKAQEAKMVVSNNAFWHYGADLGEFDFLVLDECHELMLTLAGILEFSITRADIRKFCGAALVRDVPRLGASVSTWTQFLGAVQTELNDTATSPATDEKLKGQAKFKSRSLGFTLSLLRATPRNWVITDLSGYGVDGTHPKREREGFKVTPIWSGDYFEQFIYKGIKSVLLVSATIDEAGLARMGLTKDDYDFFTLPSPFPASRRPFYCVKSPEHSARVTFKSLDKDVRKIVNSIDTVIEDRSNRNGLIHSRSYKFAEKIGGRSRHALIIPTKYALQSAVKDFKQSGIPGVLVSPSVGTGVDFPDDQCRFQVLWKVPFGDNRTDVMVARCLARGYADSLVRDLIVQQYGRGMRNSLDWCESFIFDDCFWPFYTRNAKTFPKFFREAVKLVVAIPPPLNPNQESEF